MQVLTNWYLSAFVQRTLVTKLEADWWGRSAWKGPEALGRWQAEREPGACSGNKGGLRCPGRYWQEHSQCHGTAEVGRDLCTLSAPTSCSRRGSLE